MDSSSSDHAQLYPVGVQSAEPTSFAEGSQMLVSPWIGPIDTTTPHVLQGHFKGIGSTPSIVYFGLDCATRLPTSDKAIDENRVRDVDVFVVPETEARVESYDVKASTIQVTSDSKEALKNWNAPPMNNNKRLIAFFFDGNTNRKPDYVHLHHGKHRGGYHSTVPDAGIIYLQDPSKSPPSSPNNSPTSNHLPKVVVERIIPNKTVIRCHFSSSTYLFLGPTGQKLESGKWHFYCNTLQGEALQNDPKHFRISTKYVRIFILANWGQNETETTLLFKNISFTQSKAYSFLPPSYNTVQQQQDEKEKA